MFIETLAKILKFI